MNKFTPIQKINHLEDTDYRALLDAVGTTALVSVTDTKGTILYVNKKFIEVSQYTAEELIGENHRILKSGHQPDSMFVELWQAISSGGIWRGEIKNRAKDGSYYWVDTSIAPIFTEQGELHRYIAVRFLISDKKAFEAGIIEQNRNLDKTKKAMLNILEDIETEKERAERLAQDLKKFQLAAQYSTDQIVITDAEGVIVYANPILETLTGFSVEESLGKKAGSPELWGGCMDEDFYADLWRIVKTEKKSFTGKIENKRKDGERYWASANISPILDETGEVTFFVAIERDVTREQEIDQAKTEFVSLASHQLRTPLSTINWYAEILLDGSTGKLTKEQKEYVEQMYASNQRMVDLVNSLLDVSRIELGTFQVEPVPTDIIELAESVLKEQRLEADKRKLQLKTVFDPKLPKIDIDPRLLRMVFQNLLSNAIKYTPDGGSVTYEVRKDARKKQVVFRVADSGIGIPRRQQKRIFSKLFRADNARESETDGNGLGLYIVKSVVEHSGGAISFTSTEGKGTTFTVRIPLSGMVKKEGTKELGS